MRRGIYRGCCWGQISVWGWGSRGNTAHDDEPFSKMVHGGADQVCTMKSHVDDLASRLHGSDDVRRDYDRLHEDWFWSQEDPWITLDSGTQEARSSSATCNLDNEGQYSEPVCVGVDIGHKEDDAAVEAIQIRIDNDDELDFDKEILKYGEDISREEANIYLRQITSHRSPSEYWVDDEFGGYVVSDPNELDKINRRLALHRIKAYLVSKGFTIDDRKLEQDYPPDTFKERQYFVDYEKDFEWAFHPEHCNLSGLDDYQRLVPKPQQPFEYMRWDEYRRIFSDYASDKEYLQYYEELMNRIKWIRNYVRLRPKSHKWIWKGYQEYIWSLRVDYAWHNALHGVYFEIWKRFAKENKCFREALKEVHDEKIFPLYNDMLHRELEIGQDLDVSIENQFSTYLASIHETAPESEVHEKIEKAIQNSSQRTKGYEQYAERKIAIARSVGLIPK
ncbi:hypothetical protein ACP70R_027031 [Stipagrostis hirtigluma subsp. patula]